MGKGEVEGFFKFYYALSFQKNHPEGMLVMVSDANV